MVDERIVSRASKLLQVMLPNLIQVRLARTAAYGLEVRSLLTINCAQAECADVLAALTRSRGHRWTLETQLINR